MESFVIGVMDCAALNGFSGIRVRVEVHISRGLPAFFMVGLAENSVKEARVRVQSAIINAGYEYPRGKIYINLAPADIQKNGTAFDLAIALAILKACGVITESMIEGIAAIGELSLTGEIRPVRGMLALAESIKEQGFKSLLVCRENAREASLIDGLLIKVVSNFSDVVRAILNQQVHELPDVDGGAVNGDDGGLPDMIDVVGQNEAKRALLIAAAGNHNVLFFGGPGSGKSMMAHRLPSILPPLSYEESIMLTKIYSIAGLTLSGSLISRRPFRAPHHSITKAGLVGGGSRIIRPGEISLACFGVLFLDEILEFPRTVLEVLRQPLEDGFIALSRAATSVIFPAQISLIAALNPCPCGHFGQGNNKCLCTPPAIERYQNRLSGPLIDRIDLHVNVPPVRLDLMTTECGELSSSTMRALVIDARLKQRARFSSDLTNGKMSRREIKLNANLSREALKFLLHCGEKLSLSARGFDRIIRVARTIADLANEENITPTHIGEAMHYRPAPSFSRA